MSDVIELLKSELGTQKLKDTGIGGGGCISSGSTYETDHGRVFIKVNTKSKVSLSFFFFFFFCRPRWLSWMCRPTGDQEVTGSTPAEVSNILLWRLIMKCFLQSFSPFR